MNPVRSERPKSVLRRMLDSPRPVALWDKYGLLSRPLQKSRTGETRYASLPRPNRFRLALEEGGGLFAWFGQFLSGRADLLPSPYLIQLRALQIPSQAATPPSAVPELRDRVSDPQLIGRGPCSETYRATFQGNPVVLEIYHRLPESLSEEAWKDFRRRVRLLQAAEEAPVADRTVLDHFREWLCLQADAGRKQTILRNIQDLPIRCVSRFPRPVADLSSPQCLAYEGMEGAPLWGGADSGGGPSASNRELWAEGLLEQALFLSLVDADARPENYLVVADGSLGFRALPAWIPLPVEWNNEMLQYVAAAVAGNNPRALQMLSRITASESPYGAEQLLFEKLSALQPELKINVVTPESIALLENYWRAQARTPQKSPLFLELFHRNLMVLGQSIESSAPLADPLADALWPVLGRILQFRVGTILSGEGGQEWLASSGLLLMSALRQMVLTLEQVRNNDLAVVLDHQDVDREDGSRNRRLVSLVGSAISLVFFLLSIELVFSAGGAIRGLLAAAAALVSATALCIWVARIE